jgi:O-antigen ligase
LIAGVVVVAVMMSSSTVTRLQLTVGERHYGQRDELWLTSLGMVWDRPILGWGPYLNYYELGGRMGEAFLDTHNSFLLVFTQAGFIGGIPYLIGVGYSVIAAVRARRDSCYGIVFPLLVTLIVLNQSLSWHNRKLHWIVLALALCAGRAIGPVPSARSVSRSGQRYVKHRYIGDRATV